MLCSEKLVAFCLRTISSNLGCCHVPVRGVEGVVCAIGVEGLGGVDMVDRYEQVGEAC